MSLVLLVGILQRDVLCRTRNSTCCDRSRGGHQSRCVVGGHQSRRVIGGHRSRRAIVTVRILDQGLEAVLPLSVGEVVLFPGRVGTHLELSLKTTHFFFFFFFFENICLQSVACSHVYFSHEKPWSWTPPKQEQKRPGRRQVFSPSCTVHTMYDSLRVGVLRTAAVVSRRRDSTGALCKGTRRTRSSRCRPQPSKRARDAASRGEERREQRRGAENGPIASHTRAHGPSHLRRTRDGECASHAGTAPESCARRAPAGATEDRQGRARVDTGREAGLGHSERRNSARGEHEHTARSRRRQSHRVSAHRHPRGHIRHTRAACPGAYDRPTRRG
mmetsp:Transcript_6611/g.20107  ORF Transcript_6611/g.20107 Transcript_6611/m.20107 type:complete len:331 (-) Transcript_6611:1718-2710(-)